jgi:chromosome segregation ATPase
MADSVESRIAVLAQRVEDLSIMVQVVASLPTQVGTLDYKADEVKTNLERLRISTEQELARLRNEIEQLESDLRKTAELSKERAEALREAHRIERKEDMRWRIATFITLVFGTIGVMLTVLATYG